MNDLHIIGVDIAKNTFHLHGSSQQGDVLFRKKLSRGQMAKFFAGLDGCIVALEACATAHYWAREFSSMGHSVRMVPPRYVKPFVKRQENDANDAEAIVEAALRPTMRFVQPKAEEQQALAVLYRTRDLLVRQRTQLMNALRAHLAEFGIVAGTGIQQLSKIAEIFTSGQGTLLPEAVQGACLLYIRQIDSLSAELKKLDVSLRNSSRQDAIAKQLQRIPGVGPVGATAIEAFAPPMESFKSGRGFSAWLGLVPRQNSTGGKSRLGATSKMGQADIRRHLVAGAMSVIRWGKIKGFAGNKWLERLVSRKPTMVAAIALANKMARVIWAMLNRNEEYRPRLQAAV